MEKLSISEIVGAVGGTLINIHPDGEIFGISIDTRKINQGDLYIALLGDRFDGHSFIQDALDKGASVVIASKINEDNNKRPVIYVEDEDAKFDSARE